MNLPHSPPSTEPRENRDLEAATPCPECGDTGWVHSAADDGATTVVRCACFRTSQIARLLESAGIPPRYHHARLDNFAVTSQMDRSLDEAKVFAQNFVEAFPKVPYGLLFVGPAGVGKTHLASGILHELIEQRGIAGRFADYRDLLRAIQDSYNPVSQTSELQILRPVLDAVGGPLDERLAATVRFLYGFYQDYPVRFSFILLTQHGFPEERMIDDEFEPFAMVVQFVRREMRTGQIPPGDPELLAALTMGAVLQPLIMHRYGRVEHAPVDLAEPVAGRLASLLGYDREV